MNTTSISDIVKKLESILTEAGADAPKVLAATKAFILGIKGSPWEAELEKLWPGLGAAEDTTVKAIDFLSTVEAGIVQYLPLIFKILDTLFPQPTT